MIPWRCPSAEVADGFVDVCLSLSLSFLTVLSLIYNVLQPVYNKDSILYYFVAHMLYRVLSPS